MKPAPQASGIPARGAESSLSFSLLFVPHSRLINRKVSARELLGEAGIPWDIKVPGLAEKLNKDGSSIEGVYLGVLAAPSGKALMHLVEATCPWQ